MKKKSMNRSEEASVTQLNGVGEHVEPPLGDLLRNKPMRTDKPKAPPRRKQHVEKSSRAPSALIHQIYFSPVHESRLDAKLVPLDKTGSREPLQEFSVFEHLRSAMPNSSVDLWGAVSVRFTEKTGLTGDDLHRAIAQRPGYDLYLCSPTPESEAIYPNLWLQAATLYPRFLEIVSEFFAVNGLAEQQLQETQPSVVFASSNYFVANNRFWDSYLPFVRSLVETARNSLPKTTLRLINSTCADARRSRTDVTYWPLIIERILPVFLKKYGAGLRIARIPPTSEEKLNSHLKRLREMKDVAHHTKSKWLASCWLHYRNAYLMNIASRDWCQTHLPVVTPKSIDFY